MDKLRKKTMRIGNLQPLSAKAQASGVVTVEPTMDAENVARAVVYMASLPLDANVQFMTIMATKMPFIGRG
jgi:NADP-dependent 3-hydroxy acid dehydrogenase YdfG